MPAGFVVVFDTGLELDDWGMTAIELTGLGGCLFPDDPEPEFVAINKKNIAVVTLQENNCIALIHLRRKEVLKAFSAGAVDLFNIDIEEDGIIDQTAELYTIYREPDGVVWLNNQKFVTANEGDLDGGSRGFSVFHKKKGLVFDSGSEMDQIAASMGHYPDERSENKGVEPENVAYGRYGNDRLLFVNAERAGLVYVYELPKKGLPLFKQVLPTNVGPEGGLAIPGRDIFVVASEKDDRDDKFRSTLTIYQFSGAKPQYPTLISQRDPIVSTRTNE